MGRTINTAGIYPDRAGLWYRSDFQRAMVVLVEIAFTSPSGSRVPWPAPYLAWDAEAARQSEIAWRQAS